MRQPASVVNIPVTSLPNVVFGYLVFRWPSALASKFHHLWTWVSQPASTMDGEEAAAALVGRTRSRWLKLRFIDQLTESRHINKYMKLNIEFHILLN